MTLLGALGAPGFGVTLGFRVRVGVQGLGFRVYWDPKEPTFI